MIAPAGLDGLTLSASVTPSIDTCDSRPSVGVASEIVSKPNGSLFKAGSRTSQVRPCCVRFCYQDVLENEFEIGLD